MPVETVATVGGPGAAVAGGGTSLDVFASTFLATFGSASSSTSSAGETIATVG